MALRHFVIAVVAFTSLILFVPPVQAAFTLEQVMKAPFASEASAAPKGDRVAWVLFEHGRRNIYIAAAPEWTGRQVTHFDADDGQEIEIKGIAFRFGLTR